MSDVRASHTPAHPVGATIVRGKERGRALVSFVSAAADVFICPPNYSKLLGPLAPPHTEPIEESTPEPTSDASTGAAGATTEEATLIDALRATEAHAPGESAEEQSATPVRSTTPVRAGATPAGGSDGAGVEEDRGDDEKLPAAPTGPALIPIPSIHERVRRYLDRRYALVAALKCADADLPAVAMARQSEIDNRALVLDTCIAALNLMCAGDKTVTRFTELILPGAAKDEEPWCSADFASQVDDTASISFAKSDDAFIYDSGVRSLRDFKYILTTADAIAAFTEATTPMTRLLSAAWDRATTAAVEERVLPDSAEVPANLRDAVCAAMMKDVTSYANEVASKPGAAPKDAKVPAGDVDGAFGHDLTLAHIDPVKYLIALVHTPVVVARDGASTVVLARTVIRSNIKDDNVEDPHTYLLPDLDGDKDSPFYGRWVPDPTRRGRMRWWHVIGRPTMCHITEDGENFSFAPRGMCDFLKTWVASRHFAMEMRSMYPTGTLMRQLAAFDADGVEYMHTLKAEGSVVAQRVVGQVLKSDGSVDETRPAPQVKPAVAEVHYSFSYHKAMLFHLHNPTVSNHAVLVIPVEIERRLGKMRFYAVLPATTVGPRVVYHPDGAFVYRRGHSSPVLMNLVRNELIAIASRTPRMIRPRALRARGAYVAVSILPHDESQLMIAGSLAETMCPTIAARPMESAPAASTVATAPPSTPVEYGSSGAAAAAAAAALAADAEASK